MKNKLLLGALACALLLTGCSIKAVADDEENATSEAPRPDVVLEQDGEAGPASPLADVVEEVLPSVVNVRVTSVNFDESGGVQEGRGEGSGVVIDEKGIILTNNHVVSGATEVKVVFNDDHPSMTGTVIGTIPEKDIAVISVEADDLTPIRLGSSEALRLGDEVVAIGFPLGLGSGPTVTKGIVSAKDRDIEIGGEDPGSLNDLLQTDAAINPGNSGGALIDLAGRLVGINTAAAQAGAAENVGFAIPVDDAIPIAQEILSKPPEQRAWLGVQIDTVGSAAVAEQLGLDPSVRGAIVAGLFPDSPAAEGGVEQGDVVTELDGTKLESAEDLTTTVAGFEPGQIIDVVVVRGDETLTLQVELGQRPATIPLPEETP